MPLFYFLELGKVTIILQDVKNTNTVNSFHILSARSMTISFSIILHSTFKGAVAHGDYFFPKKFEFVSLCSFICLQAVYQLSGPVCKATWSGCPSYSASHLHFTLCD